MHCLSILISRLKIGLRWYVTSLVLKIEYDYAFSHNNKVYPKHQSHQIAFNQTES